MRKGRAVKGADSKERGRDGEGYCFSCFLPNALASVSCFSHWENDGYILVYIAY